MSDKDALKIGEFARLADTNLRTLRYYEELGLLRPSYRSAGGFRYYRRTDVNRVQLIRDLQELGLQLEQIRDLIAVREPESNRDQFVARVREALTVHSQLLLERLTALQEQQGKVDKALEKLARCEDCEHSPAPANNHCEPCVRTGEPLPDILSALF